MKLRVGKAGSKNKDDAPHELESQFVLRLPPEYASTVRRAVQSGSVNLRDRLTIELHADGRHGIVRVDRVPLACKLVDLPCILESLKTVDKKTFYKTADVCQMLVCTVDGDLYPPLEEPTGITDPKNKKKDKDKEKKFVWNHGRWEVIAEDETKEADNHGSLANLDSSPGTSGHKLGHGSSVERDELREIFNDISSSSEDEEDEGDRHEDEDLNIMDTEEDLEQQLQEKLNESDGARDESEGNNQIGWEVIAEDETKEADNHGSLANLDSSPGTSGHKLGHGSSVERDELREIFNDISSSSEDEEDEGDRHEDRWVFRMGVERDELREIFNDISSSSEDEEDEGDRHEDEDLNIMDTEEDLEQQLQEKLNESDGARDESEGNNQIVLEFQVQINNVKNKLQETQDRKKQQEDLIMKVENLALKNRFQTLLDEIIQEEERLMEQHTGLYPMVSKGIRKVAMGIDPLEGQKHMCGMGNMFDYHSMGYEDLDELMKEPQALIFIMELVQVDDPFSYKRDSWAMSKDEKLKVVPVLHGEGNSLVKKGCYRAASERYQEAVICLRNVQAKENPGHEDWVKLENLITPLVLNYCQCMLELEEYYEVLEHTNELISKHKDNVKAYYKRAKAHAAVWNEVEARQDFLTAANLDPSLAPAVRKELRLLEERMRTKYSEEKKTYWGILEDNGGETRVRESQRNMEDSSAADSKRDTNEKTEAGDEPAPRTNQTSSKEGKGKEQMLRLVPFLNNEGNYLLTEQRYREASEKYQEAIVYLKTVQAKEKHDEEDLASLENLLCPIVLNYCQCMLKLKEYNEVLEHTTELISKHKDNVKAYYKRGKAHAALFNDKEARKDFLTVCKLDPMFGPTVRKDLKIMGEAMRAKLSNQMKSYWGGVKERHEQRGETKGAERQRDIEGLGGAKEKGTNMKEENGLNRGIGTKKTGESTSVENNGNRAAETVRSHDNTGAVKEENNETTTVTSKDATNKNVEAGIVERNEITGIGIAESKETNDNTSKEWTNEITRAGMEVADTNTYTGIKKEKEASENNAAVTGKEWTNENARAGIDESEDTGEFTDENTAAATEQSNGINQNKEAGKSVTNENIGQGISAQHIDVAIKGAK
ncbi:UNVERIFIED_CONTAM: hypothetical protein FKN15_053114 [Acipenser sinensis]